MRMLLITMLIVLSVAVAFAAPVTEDSKIQPDFLQDDVSFGAAVAANGNHFVAAAPRYAGPAPPPTSSQGWGRIVEYQWDGNVFTQVSYLDGTDNCQQFSYILDFSLDATGEGLVAGIKKQNCSALFPVPSTTSAYHRDLNGLWEKVVGFSGVRDSVSVTTSGQTPTFLTGNASATVTTDSVTEIDMNNWEGQGYHNNDVGRPVEIAAPTTPGGVTATAEIGRVSAFGGVSRIDVLSGGSGYTSNPNVTLPAPIGGGGVPGNASASRNAHVGSVTFSDVEGILPNETLKPGDGSDGDLFGGEVAIDGDVAAIAARGATKVYIAERAGGGWEITQTLEPAAADTSGFGQALALAGDHLVVGAPGTDNGGLTDVGRAFYFDLGNLAAGEVVLTPAAPVARESFGAAVAVSEDGTVVVGAPGQIYQDLMVGRAFIYAVAVAGNVPELAELVPSDGAVGDDFGLGIAIVEGQALVGAPDHDNGRGAVYVFDVVNDLPAVDAIADPTIDEDDSEQTVNLTGISAGGGEAQPLRVTAASNNRDLVPDPAVTYTSPAPTGSLQYTPVAGQSGTATITVTVEDGGTDGDLDTAADNATFSRAFTITVNELNDTPTLDAIADPTIDEDAPEQTVNLAGIGAGGGEAQPLRVTAASSDSDLVPDPAVTYTSPAPTGSLQYTPVADQSGTATITVTVEDGGLDGDLDTAADNAAYSQAFTITVNELNDTPTLDAIENATIDEDALEQTVTLTGISAGGADAQPLRVTTASSNSDLIPDPAVTYVSPAPTGSLQYTPVAGQSGTATITVTVEDGGPDDDLDTAADNTVFNRGFTITVNELNDTPALDPIADAILDENAPEQTVNLAGINAGGGEAQPLRVTAASSDNDLVPDPAVTYVSPAPTGSLRYTPVADQSGAATITVTVEDGGLDGDLDTAADNATFSREFTVRFPTDLMFELTLTDGWNLFSIPIDLDDSSVATVLQGRNTGSVWGWANNKYTAVTNLAPGQGYWVKLDGATIIEVTGPPAISTRRVLAAGWNLIGAIGMPPYNDVLLPLTTVSGDSVNAPFWGWTDAHYTKQDDLQMGHGYWGFSSGPGTVELGE